MSTDNVQENYIFSEHNVNMLHKNSLPLKELLILAKQIWQDCQRNSNNKEYDTMFTKYRDFGTSFPLVLKWMVHMNKYSERAFKKFLIKYNATNISSKKDFLILQADYIVYLYEEDKHYDKKNVNNYREFIIKQLLEEEEELKQIEDEFKSKIEKIESNNDNEKRQLLFDYISNLKTNN